VPKTRSKDGQQNLPGFTQETPRPQGVPSREHPFVDATGYVWLDVFTGEPPVTDANGRLLQPHHISMAYYPYETWSPGIALPRTPKAQDELNEQMKAERERAQRYAARQDAPMPTAKAKRKVARKAA